MTQRLGSARGKRGDRNLVGSHGRRDEHWPHASKLVETRAAALPKTVYPGCELLIREDSGETAAYTRHTYTIAIARVARYGTNPQ